ncbi:hypothetical protein FYJ68_06430 [Olsenella sp. CA-Schmier-601-WT-1]|uniref:Uncharacterized protein n=1 Tax=Olsenella porci TaxID=2652279 RepID=A0A6N7XS32_9ACTN|nr:hypothetical protein [Olsenella porci]
MVDVLVVDHHADGTGGVVGWRRRRGLRNLVERVPVGHAGQGGDDPDGPGGENHEGEPAHVSPVEGERGGVD